MRGDQRSPRLALDREGPRLHAIGLRDALPRPPDPRRQRHVSCHVPPLADRCNLSRTEADALRHAVAIETALASMIDDGEEIPPPAGVTRALR